MGGTFESMNKVLPGVYMNFMTNEPLSIQVSDRGTVFLMQEMSVGAKGEVYTITALENDYPEGITSKDKKLVMEALKLAKTVKIYNLGNTKHNADDVNAALTKFRTETFDTLCYPYDAEDGTEIKNTIVAWLKSMNDDEGVGVNGVLANCKADSEYVINVANAVVLEDGELTVAETTAWVAGATAGASISTSNTNMKYVGAIDVKPRMTKTEMEMAINDGKFIFKVDSSQNVTAVYDINSLTSFTPEKSKKFRKNRIVRAIFNIKNDIRIIFESNYLGKYDNNTDGRSLLRAALIEYFNALQKLRAIKNFVADDVTVTEGPEGDAVVINVAIQPVDSIEKIYITVNM